MHYVSSDRLLGKNALSLTQNNLTKILDLNHFSMGKLTNAEYGIVKIAGLDSAKHLAQKTKNVEIFFLITKD